MKARFWGVRGSIPTPISTKEIKSKTKRVLKGAAGVDLSNEDAVNEYLDSLSIFKLGTVGGNSSCMELRVGDELFIFDAGSGIRELGLELMKTEFGKGQGTAHIFFGHTHWDHIMGLPFFIPLYVPGNNIIFHGCHDRLEARIRNQQQPDHFPVSLDIMASTKKFVELKTLEQYEIGDAVVTPFPLSHPGNAFGYRIESKGKVFVYATDTEFKATSEKDTEPIKDADVMVLDTMYTFDDVLAKTDWGHCSPFIGVDIAQAENIKKLVLFHHEPVYLDADLEKMLKKTLHYKERMYPDSKLEVLLAYEGMEIVV